MSLVAKCEKLKTKYMHSIYGHTMDTTDDYILIYGHRNSRYMYNPNEKDEENIWKEFSSDLYKHQLPVSRRFHTTIKHEEKLIIFGGKDYDNLNIFPKKIWSFSLKKQNFKELIVEGETYPRCEHVSVLIDDLMIIFGFYFDQRNNWTSILDLKKKKWIYDQIENINNSILPDPRSQHTGVVYKDFLFILGVKDLVIVQLLKIRKCSFLVNKSEKIEKLNDLWFYDFEKNYFKEIKVQGFQIYPRIFSKVCSFKGHFYIFGGINHPNQDFNCNFFKITLEKIKRKRKEKLEDESKKIKQF
eukprot:gene993-9899_t